MCSSQSTLEIIFVARRKDRKQLRRVFLLRAAENLAVITYYRPTNLFQARFELELHEDSYPVFTRPHHFEALMLVNSRHFQKSGLRLPDLEPPTISSNPVSLEFPGCALLALVRPEPSTLAPSLQRSRSVPWPVVLDLQSCTPWCFSGPVMFFLFSAGGYRQISTVTHFQAHPSGFLHWARGPCSRAAGGSFLTGAVLKARSAGGVSGSFGRSVLKPQLLAGCCPSSQALLSFTNSKCLLNSQIFPKAQSSPNNALSRSRNNRFIIPLV